MEATENHRFIFKLRLPGMVSRSGKLLRNETKTLHVRSVCPPGADVLLLLE